MRSILIILCILSGLWGQAFAFGSHVSAVAYAKKPFQAVGNQPAQADIDVAMQAAESQGRVINVVAGGISAPAAMKEITSLPVIFRATISGAAYEVVVMSMSITPAGARLTAGARFRVPDSQTDLYFGSNEIAVSGKSGFMGSMPILESTLEGDFKEFIIPRLGNNFLMGLDKSSKLDFSCGAFKEFDLSGRIKVSSLVALEGADGKAASGPLLIAFADQHVGDWKDILISGKVSAAFHSAAYPDLGFQFAGNDLAQIDLSDFRNPGRVPSCAQVSGGAWQGIALPSFRVRLPTFFKLRAGVILASTGGSNLFLDGKGLVGSVLAENVFSLSQGYTDEENKFDMSLSKLSADYSCNGQVTASMLGQIALPWCGGNVATPDAPMLWYSFRYINGHYESFVKDSERGQFASDRYKLSTGSEMSFNLSPGALNIQATHNQKPGISADVFNNSVCREFPATLTASGCEGKELVWSTGAIGAAVQVKPLETTTYWVKCRDKYCVAASSDSLKLTVYESLPKPTLTAGREVICNYESTELRAENCVGVMEWKAPGAAGFAVAGPDDLVRNVSFPGQPGVATPGTYTYTVRCNLNGCYSPEASKTVRVLAEPQMPALYSNAPNNTIDRNGSVTLGGSCTDGNRLVWENLANVTVALTSTATYRAVCRNDQTGCQSQAPASITINVLYLPPAAPSDLAFSNITTNSMTLTWRDNAYNEDGFTILRSLSPDFASPLTVGQVGPGVTSINDGGLSEGVTYYYQVIASNKYDQAASERASQRTLVKPSAPVLAADKMSIVKGSAANVYGTCASGTLVWTVPVGFGGGQRQQNENTTYWAKCVNQGVEGPGASITVSVYTPAPNMPHLSVAAASVVKGSKANVTGYCDSGTLVWTVPVGFSGGERVQNENTTYWAKCVNEGGESPGASVTVSVYTPAPNMPHLSASNTNIEKGSKVNVTGYCDNGTLVWTVPVGFNGGERVQSENTTYWAKCVNEAGEGPGANITVNVYERPTAQRPNLRPDKNPVKPGENTVVYADGCDGTVTWSTGATGNSIWTGAGNYSAVCKKDGYRDSDAATITIFQDNTPTELPQAPRPNLRSDKNPLKPNENTVVYADGCDGTVIWSNGSTGNSIWTGAGDYSAICRKDGHGDSERAYITVGLDNSPTELPQAPRPNLRAEKGSLKPGENTVVYADGCDGTVVWSSGSTGNSIWTGAGDYSAVCRKDGYRESERAYINIPVDNNPDPQAPTPNLRAEINPVDPGQQTRIFADGCAGTVVWSNGSTENPLTGGAGDYSAICQMSSHRDSQRAYIKIEQRSNPCPSPVAPALSGPDEVGKGQAFALYLTGCNGATYTTNISPGQQFRAIEDNKLFFYGSIDNTTQFQVECRKDGCVSASASKTVRVKPLCVTPAAPSVSGPGKVFKDEAFTLTASGCDDASTFNWSGPGSPLARVPAGSSTYEARISSQTTFRVSCTLAGGCTSPETSFVVGVIDIPKLVDTTPKWQSQGWGSCPGRTGEQWKDVNPDSPTYNQTYCCKYYLITPGESNNRWRVSYQRCDGSMADDADNYPGSNRDAFVIEAREGSVRCISCTVEEYR